MSQVSQFLKDGYLHLPSTLLVFLRSNRIEKVGVHIKADLTRLYNDCGLPPPLESDSLPFVGAVELGLLAQSRAITSQANVGLAELAALVLRRHLPKDEAVRISEGWDEPALSDAHTNYAALDVYATWAVYEALVSPAPLPTTAITDSTLPGTQVKLLSRDRRSVVAYGTIALDRPPKFKNVNLTKNRAIVNITRVVQSGYKIRADLLASRTETPISQVSEACPFGLLCATRDLSPYRPGEEFNLPAQDSPLPNLSLFSNSAFAVHSAGPPTESPVAAAPTPSNSSDRAAVSQHPTASTDSERAVPEEPEGAAVDDEAQDWHNSLAPDPAIEQSISNAQSDPVALAYAQVLIQRLEVSTDNYQEPLVRSRVLGDIWHLMDQFKIPIHHGFRRPFTRALRDAILLPDPGDRSAVEAVLQKRNISWTQMLYSHSDWLWQRVRRFVPKPEVLFQRVRDVFVMFGPFKDATTGLPLFNDACWEKAANVLENIRLGYYSDPPGIQLYMISGKDRDGLTLYRCIRGTNNVEGGIHQNIAKRFGSYNASPRLAVNLIRDYRFCHNVEV